MSPLDINVNAESAGAESPGPGHLTVSPWPACEATATLTVAMTVPATLAADAAPAAVCGRGILAQLVARRRHWQLFSGVGHGFTVTVTGKSVCCHES